jgi:type IV pilus assembly protein PilE
MHIQNQQGVTLIELVVTAAILAILAGIAIPAYKGYMKTSHKSECQNEMAAIKLAEAEFFLDSNSYFSGTDVNDLYNKSNNIYQPSSAAKSTKTECDYSVTITTSPDTYTIKATPGANGHLVGEGDMYVSGP